MGRKRFTLEQIITMLREAEMLLSQEALGKMDMSNPSTGNSGTSC